MARFVVSGQVDGISDRDRAFRAAEREAQIGSAATAVRMRVNAE
jgi:hypothetical protein